MREELSQTTLILIDSAWPRVDLHPLLGRERRIPSDSQSFAVLPSPERYEFCGRVSLQGTAHWTHHCQRPYPIQQKTCKKDFPKVLSNPSPWCARLEWHRQLALKCTDLSPQTWFCKERIFCKSCAHFPHGRFCCQWGSVWTHCICANTTPKQQQQQQQQKRSIHSLVNYTEHCLCTFSVF